jgi:hypothetical protein
MAIPESNTKRIWPPVVGFAAAPILGVEGWTSRGDVQLGAWHYLALILGVLATPARLSCQEGR